jgi:hypothetical protein
MEEKDVLLIRFLVVRVLLMIREILENFSRFFAYHVPLNFRTFAIRFCFGLKFKILKQNSLEILILIIKYPKPFRVKFLNFFKNIYKKLVIEPTMEI